MTPEQIQKLKLVRHVMGVEVYADEDGNEYINQPDGSLVDANTGELVEGTTR